jgi:predicted permease
MIRDLLQDLRYGARRLRRSPGFTLMVTLSLALGIGANGAIFNLVNALYLKPLPVRAPDRLVLLSGPNGNSGSGPLQAGAIDTYSYDLYRWLRANDQALDGLAAQRVGVTRATVRWGASDPAEVAAGRLVSASYFDVAGVSAFRGRTFQPSDETVGGADRVVVLAHGYWQRRFGGNPAVIGARLTINGGDYTVVGVAPPAFVGLDVARITDFWAPLTMQAELDGGDSLLERRDHWWLTLFGRSRPGVAPATAAASLNLALQRYLADNQVHGKQVAREAVRVELAPGAHGLSAMRGTFREALVVMAGAVGLLFLIVCLNVSHLLLARAVSRQHEMVVRAALGASRGRLLRQLLAEGLLLSTLGASLGAVAARWLSDGLIAVTSRGQGAVTLDVSLDWRVFGFMASLAVATAVVLGLVPAWQASRRDLQAILRARASGGAAAGSPRRAATRVLMASQVAFSLVLLVGAGLLALTVDRLRNVDKGFDGEQLVQVQMVPGATGPSPAALAARDADLLARVRALPGVRAASLSRDGILSGSQSSKSAVVPGPTRSMTSVVTEIVTPGYFETVGMSLVRGRGFTRDDHPGAARVVVINEALARRLFANAPDVLGRRFRFWDSDHLLEVVGVVRDARTGALRREASRMAYLPAAQATPPVPLRTLEVRAAADPAIVAERIRHTLSTVHPPLPIQSIRTMDALIGRAVQRERVLAILSTVVGLVALFLVSLGLYGVIAEWAGQRTQEIGLRMALGAPGSAVRWLVLRQALLLVSAGAALGIPAAIAIGHLMRKLLYGVSPTDPATLAGAALVMLGVAGAAAYLPARRASRVDPMTALRCE